MGEIRLYLRASSFVFDFVFVVAAKALIPNCCTEQGLNFGCHKFFFSCLPSPMIGWRCFCVSNDFIEIVNKIRLNCLLLYFKITSIEGVKNSIVILATNKPKHISIQVWVFLFLFFENQLFTGLQKLL